MRLLLVAFSLLVVAAPALPNTACAQPTTTPEAPVGAERTTQVLSQVGKHKVCDSAPGLAGWLLRDRTVWSLSKVLDGERGKPGARGIVVSFFATWCKPCKKGLPILQALAPELKEAGVPVVLVAVPPFAGQSVLGFLDGIEVRLPTIKDKFGGILKQWLLGRDEASDALKLPRTVVLNDTQQVVAVFGEEGPDFAERLRDKVKTVGKACRPVRKRK